MITEGSVEGGTVIGLPGHLLDDLTEQLKAVNVKLDRLIEIQLQALRLPADRFISLDDDMNRVPEG